MMASRINISIVIEEENIHITKKDRLTLMSLENIIIDCFKDKRDFILARVKSTPLSLIKGTYYEYYWANSLNRVLFKVNPETNSILKFSIKSPYNKSYILGTVDYYKIPFDTSLLLYILTGKMRYLKQLKSNNGKIPIDVEKVNDVAQRPIITLKAAPFATEVDFINNKELRDYFKSNLNTGEVHFLFPLNTGKVNINSIEKVVSVESHLKNNRVVKLRHFLWFSVLIMTLLLVTLLLLPEFSDIIILAVSVCCFVTLCLLVYIVWFAKS